MDKLIVATAQQQMRLFDTPDGYRRDLIRFLSMARAKGAKLVVFPPYAGVMAGSHAVEGFRVGLLKQASERQRPGRSLWSRTRTAVAEGTASLLGASYRRTYTTVLQVDPEQFAEGYTSLFAELAGTYEMTIVAGSAFLPAADGELRHRVTVFGPDGAVLGHQDKLLLSREDGGIAIAGEGWGPVDSPVGRLGILSEQEALYPEAARVLAYAGADLIITLAAVGSESLAAYVRHAALAHAQANRCFSLSAFLVGRNYLAAEEGSTPGFQGRSGIYAPLDMTPRYSGVLVEIGASDAEGLLTAELDRGQLHYLWENATEPVRRAMPVALFGPALSAVYTAGRTLDDAWQVGPLGEATAEIMPAVPPEDAWEEPEPEVTASLEEENTAPLEDPEAQGESMADAGVDDDDERQARDGADPISQP